MKVAQLLELLEDMDPQAEVLVAHQPEWPLQLMVSDVVEFEAELQDDEVDETPAAVYVVAVDHPRDRSPYAPRSVFGR